MGNRAVIAFGPDKPDTIGVYLHWNGGRDSVEGFLEAAKTLKLRDPLDDCYGIARFCQIVGNCFGGGLSLGVDVLARLDCDNGNNGVYFVGPGWTIRGRKYHRTDEQREHDVTEVRDLVLAASRQFFAGDGSTVARR